MNTQTLGGLASDQKIDKVFRVFGFSIPVAKDGRRLWPTKFKREMARQMISGKLSISDVQKTCQVSDNTAHQWKKKYGKRDSGDRQRAVVGFAELKLEDSAAAEPKVERLITLKHGGSELCLPADYPVKQLAELIRSLEGRR